MLNIGQHFAKLWKKNIVRLFWRTVYSLEILTIQSLLRSNANVITAIAELTGKMPKFHHTGAYTPSYVIVFIARGSYASGVLGIAILCVRPSVCHTRALWRNERTHCRYFDTGTIWKNNHSSLLIPTFVGARPSLPLKICGQNDPPPVKNADFDQYLPITSQP